jgi:Tol biopolymer transport system component
MSIIFRKLTLFVAAALICVPIFSTDKALAAFPGTNGKILYTKFSSTLTDGTYQQADGNIYTADPDGTNEQVFGQTSQYPNLQFSPTGKQILYRTQAWNDAACSNMTISNLDGSNQRNVFSGCFISDFHWTQDGLGLTYRVCSPGGPCNYTQEVNLDGSGQKTLVNSGYGKLSPRADAYITLTNDGSNNSVVKYTAIGSSPAQSLATIYSSANTCMSSCYFSPTWSPDNTQVAFWKNGADINTTTLVILNTQTHASQEYIYTGRARSAAWSPDGKTILFTADNSTTLPYYGYPYNPKMLSFSLTSHQFSTLSIQRPLDILDWQPIANPPLYRLAN